MESTGSNAGISPLDELQRQLAEDLAQVVAAPTPPPAAQPPTNLVATTVSTIVLQGGPLQLVIALLKVSHPGYHIDDYRKHARDSFHDRHDLLRGDHSPGVASKNHRREVKVICAYYVCGARRPECRSLVVRGIEDYRLDPGRSIA